MLNLRVPWVPALSSICRLNENVPRRVARPEMVVELPVVLCSVRPGGKLPCATDQVYPAPEPPDAERVSEYISLISAKGRDVVSIIGTAGRSVTMMEIDPEALLPSESVTVMVAANMPAAVSVPLIAAEGRLDVLRVSPSGRAPPLTAQL